MLDMFKNRSPLWWVGWVLNSLLAAAFIFLFAVLIALFG